MNNLIIFDVCGTMYNSNTTYDFLLFYFKRKNLSKFYKLRLALSKPAKVIWKIAIIFGFKLNLRVHFLSYLDGEPIWDIKAVAEEFTNDYLNFRKVEKVHQNLNLHLRETLSNVILASASIEPVVEAIAKNLKVQNYICTTLSSQDGYYSGRIELDMQGNKHSYIKELIGSKRFNQIVVYTDNKEDLNLIQLAHKVFILTKSKDIRYWSKKLIRQNYTLLRK